MWVASTQIVYNNSSANSCTEDRSSSILVFGQLRWAGWSSRTGGDKHRISAPSLSQNTKEN